MLNSPFLPPSLSEVSRPSFTLLGFFLITDGHLSRSRTILPSLLTLYLEKPRIQSYNLRPYEVLAQLPIRRNIQYLLLLQRSPPPRNTRRIRHLHIRPREVPLLPLERNLRHDVGMRSNIRIALPIDDEVIESQGFRHGSSQDLDLPRRGAVLIDGHAAVDAKRGVSEVELVIVGGDAVETKGEGGGAVCEERVSEGDVVLASGGVDSPDGAAVRVSDEDEVMIGC